MLAELFAETWRNARARWLRVALTGSGIVWGLALFICLSAMGQGSREHYRAKMEAIGRKVIYVFPGSVAGREGHELATRAIKLDRDDPERLPGSPRIESASAELWSGTLVIKGNGRTKVVYTYGVEPQAQKIRNYQVGSGRFITAEDMENRARVVVIGSKVAERLFGRKSAVGQEVRIEGNPFRVVGVSKKKGEQMVNMGPPDDEQVLMPISTAQTLFTHNDSINYILFDPRSRDEGAEAMDRVRAILSRHHDFGPADSQAVDFFNSWDMIRTIDAMGAGLQIFLLACGLMTLAAGGVGVMNIMLVAVAERTRELALRKALGASNRDIFIQLLLETVIVTVASGSAGLLLGSAIVRMLQISRDRAGDSMILSRPILSFSILATGFLVLVGTGILAGIMPARRAARLDPAAGLRLE